MIVWELKDRMIESPVGFFLLWAKILLYLFCNIGRGCPGQLKHKYQIDLAKEIITEI
jgi:hypothetical protein